MHPRRLEIAFEAGLPVAINGVPMTLTELIESVTTIAANHGVGRVTDTSGTPLEAPAAVVFQAAHEALGANASRASGATVCLELFKGQHGSLRSTFMTLWSGRFDTAPDPAAFDFGVSFGFDRALFEDDVTGSLAWAEALAAAGVLGEDGRGAIGKALEAILEEGRRDPASVAGPDEDVHSFVERKLVERIGDAGRRLHTGRSRNEQVSLDLRLYLRRRIPLLQQASEPARRGVRRSGRACRRGADAVVHAPAPRAAGAGRAFLPRARRRRCGATSSRLDAAARRSRRAAARLRRDRRHELSGGYRAARHAPRLLARRPQQHGRVVRSRFRRVVPLRRRRSRWCI